MKLDKKMVCRKCADVVDSFTLEKTERRYSVFSWDEKLQKYIETVSSVNSVDCVSCRKCGNVLDEEEEMCGDQMSAEQAIGGIYGLFGGRFNSQVM